MSWWFDLQARGVSVTGPIPAGLPALERADLTSAQMLLLVMPAVAIFLVSYSDAVLT